MHGFPQWSRHHGRRFLHIQRTATFAADQRRSSTGSSREVAKAQADYDSAGAAVQQIADLEAQRQSLVNLHDQYIRSQQPPEQSEVTAEERFARPLERMTWEDGLDVSRNSQYGKDLDANDPNVQAGFREVMRRRARGE